MRLILKYSVAEILRMLNYTFCITISGALYFFEFFLTVYPFPRGPDPTHVGASSIEFALLNAMIHSSMYLRKKYLVPHLLYAIGTGMMVESWLSLLASFTLAFTLLF
jgi:hypothetical protein